MRNIRIAIPPGIGDAVWPLVKLQSFMSQNGFSDKADVAICGKPPCRAKPFIERFSFVENCWNADYSTVEDQFWTKDGVYNHAPTQPGWHGEFDWLLNCNQHLEYGKRLEEWLPDYEPNWDIADEFRFTTEELINAALLRMDLGPFAVFYFGPESGNTKAGHNRDEMWTPYDWVAVADYVRASGLRIVVVGAEYDRSYVERLRWLIGDFYCAIGAWHIAQTFAVIKQSQFFIGYQSGLGIFANYLKVPVAMWWREQGNSINPDRYVSFSEDMATAWTRPDFDEYMPLIYGKCDGPSVVENLKGRGWMHREWAKQQEDRNRKKGIGRL